MEEDARARDRKRDYNAHADGRPRGDSQHSDRRSSNGNGGGSDRHYSGNGSSRGSHHQDQYRSERSHDDRHRSRPNRDESSSRYGEKRSPSAHTGHGDESLVRGYKRIKTEIDDASSAAGTSAGAPTGDAPRERTRKNRERYEMVLSRPSNVVSKQGVSGQSVNLTANYFKLLKKPEWSLYQYRVDFSPDIEIPGLRKRLIYEHKSSIGGYIFDGKNTLYLTQVVAADKNVFTKNDREGNPVEITIKLVGLIQMNTTESLQVLNLILKRAMDGLKLQLVGRNLFDAAAKVDIRQYNIQLWPGYTTSIRQHEKDILLCAEITNKVMRTKTIYDFIRDIVQSGANFTEAFTNQVLGMTVLTDYNNKTYRIDDVSFDTTPKSTFDTKEGKVSFIDYYKKKYNIIIRDKDQPMLMSKAKEKSLRGGASEIIALVPELCRATGLDEDMRKNFQLMKSMAQYTRMDPRNRAEKLMDFNRRLSRTPASVDILKEWNFKLDSELIRIPGRILKNENIAFGGSVKEPTDKFKADWQQAFRNNAMFAQHRLENWFFIYPHKLGHNANMFEDSLRQVSHGMRFEMSRPQHLKINDDRNHSYINAIEQAANHDPQLILLIVPNNNADRYANIKKKCCVERAIASQVMCQRTIMPKNNNPNSLKSVATKVAIQLNCKLGGAPWMIEMPLKDLMTIGFDISRDNKDKGKCFGAMVATMDLKQNVEFFSTVNAHSDGEEMSNHMAINVAKALKAYFDLHKVLPKKILVFRDGVGDGQTKYVLEHEVQQLRNKLKEIYEKVNLEYKLCFIIVSKKINTRIFNNGSNPPPGTVVDDVITLPERYDFYLISQSVGQGTVSPTSYNILYDNMGLPIDKLQQLCYKQCHLYYNWCGTTRVPAVCQYAHKLAFLVGQSIHQSPSNRLERQLFYL